MFRIVFLYRDRTPALETEPMRAMYLTPTIDKSMWPRHLIRIVRVDT